MSLSEFELIHRYFDRPLARDAGVSLGIGDDAAVLDPPAGAQLVVTTDTLVAGVHFSEDTAPADLGYKALAVNLSDCAAMGAEPRWWLLSLTLPEIGEAWLDAFSGGCHELAAKFGLSLVGGDLTRGRLNICIQVLAVVPRGRAVRRAGAVPGDLIFVTGCLGDAAAALRLHEPGWTADPREAEYLAGRLRRPVPRLALAAVLRESATAAIDVSDGLAADLGHVLAASGAGACIHAEALPLSDALRAACAPGLALECALHGGDDYELCFTVAPGNAAALGDAARAAGCAVSQIGEIRAGGGLVLRTGAVERPIETRGYRHF